MGIIERYLLNCGMVGAPTPVEVSHEMARRCENKPHEMFAVFNINGDVIGIADSRENAVGIYKERYGLAEDSDVKMAPFPLNEMVWA